MSHPPSAPAKVPAAATTYTLATQDADLRSQINTLLLREGHAAKIQERFLHSLNAHTSNWPSAIQSHALALLRSGEVTTFPALMRRVLEDVRRDSAAATAALASSTTANNSGQASSSATNASESAPGVNGAATAVNGASKKNGATGAAGADGSANLAIPTAVVEAVLKDVKESLEAVCEVENDGSAGG